MLQSIQDHPIMYTVVLLLIVLCVFAWGKAAKASRTRREKRDAIIAELEREKALRREFRNPTPQQLEDAPPARLIEGLCCHVQQRLEKHDDPEAAFADLPEAARLIYAFGYVLLDGRERLSEFFRKNGQPLTGAAMQAADKLGGGEYAEIFRAQYTAFDDENEEASVIESEIDALDARFLKLTQECTEQLYAETRRYILSHSGIFTNL